MKNLLFFNKVAKLFIINTLLLLQPLYAQITLEHNFNETVTFQMGLVNGAMNIFMDATPYQDNTFYTAFLSGNSYKVKTYDTDYNLSMNKTFNFTPPEGYKVSSVSMSKKLFNTDNDYEFIVTYTKISPVAYDNTNYYVILYNQNGSIIKDFGKGAVVQVYPYLFIINNSFKMQVNRSLWNESNNSSTQTEIYSVPGIPPKAPTITTTTLPNGTVGIGYNTTILASGETPIYWGLESGNLPNGLNISSSGTISGVPTLFGVYAFTIIAANSIGSVTKDFTITITKPELSGSVNINGNAVFGETLTAQPNLTSTISDLGTISYQWKRNGVNIGTNSPTYTLVQNDIGATITVTVNTANCTGEVSSPPTATVTKATQTAPDAPELAHSTTTSITLVSVADFEYNINGGIWNNSPTFTELTPSTTYTFTQRKAETEIFLASPASMEAYFNTQELDIEDILFAEVNIYPNPTTGELRIDCGELIAKNVEIFDLMGKNRINESKPQSENVWILDISHFSTGVYFVRISTANGEMVKKMVKE